ncbi:sulfotransferase [Rugosimonospora acidiphila]|uniref:Sulfotransferase n=1 Tax=Rugosimonospora acidiphila TaxID=556531 RepID=A0ABP9S296_9ACTN
MNTASVPAGSPERGSLTKVVYILGRGRSGSTTLGQVLGAGNGFFYAGEIRYLWDPVLTHNTPCACGEQLSECPVWGKVLAELTHIDLDQIVRYQREVLRESNLVRLMRTRPDQAWPALAAFRDATDDLYSAIAKVTGCRVIVDSSKRPSHALVLRYAPSLAPYYVHLVRDPRASAYSWRNRQYSGGAGDQIRQRSSFDATLRWLLLNVSSELITYRTGRERLRRMRYEDFIAAPRDTIAELADWVGETLDESSFADERTVRVPVSHAIAGNPVRSRTGEVVLRDSGEWQRSQPSRDRLIATTVAAPVLHRYGYPFKP